MSVRGIGRLLGCSLGMMLVLSLACGVLYPLAVTGVAQTAFPGRADGSLVALDGEVVGSRLVGQGFAAPAYFHSRPSATADSALPTSFANLGPASAVLKTQVERRVAAALRLEGPYTPGLAAADLPVDMLTTSASGVDPDVSRASARLQARRVATVRGVALARVLALVRAESSGRTLGLLGEPRVNVLLLNLRLDQSFGAPAPTAGRP